MPSEDLEPLGCVCRYTLSPTLDPDLDYNKGAVSRGHRTAGHY